MPAPIVKTVQRRIPTEVEKAYMAGIIDGEGCIGASALRDKRRGRCQSVMFCVFVTMCDKEVLELFLDIYGGHIRVHKKNNDKPHWRTCYTWQAYGEIGAILLRDIMPYLRLKLRQAEVYIRARETFTGGPRKGHSGPTSPSEDDLKKRFACLYEIQALNQRAA